MGNIVNPSAPNALFLTNALLVLFIIPDDLFHELSVSEKDRAENIMIVDLMRNDLSKIAQPDSVQVGKLCGIEQYENVLHLVSVVNGVLDKTFDTVDVLKAVFPGGSITGAPKIRAMEIISELEPTVRGPYCGSLGYINFDGYDRFQYFDSYRYRTGWLVANSRWGRNCR